MVGLILWLTKWTCCLLGGLGCALVGIVAAVVLWGNGVRTLGERQGP